MAPHVLFPSVRPPGTILTSYPFGMTADFRGFHFRSVFLPLLCTILAVYVAAGRDNIKRHGWQVAGFALLLSSLPMFYWLDRNDTRSFNNGWGMVDGFQAGFAALSGAAIVRSIATRSHAWLIVLAFEWRLAPQEARPLRGY